MLVLSRKKGEAIMIGSEIELTVLEVTADGVKLGISAPKEVGILRKELFIAIADTNKEARMPALSLTELKKQFQDPRRNG
ncbi:carbon storage regulator CsrA [Paenibacillus mendelii]|uniref:Translational regulator CsrA n=1 Tax=Paenibacillus mendelii TaxID=206163 RepID=A0ABV6J6F1_9BACL|nr:carbon storage regulator CsrA [Paenibacillus mendelii]MCQ6563561.1 carbon storage regulator CsrA [Paenibacillus mendelii]